MKSSILAIFLLVVGCSKTPPPPADTPLAPLAPKRADLMKSIINDDYPRFQEALTRGANINQNFGGPGKEITPLLTAIAFRRGRMVEELINRGVAIHPSYQGYNARDFAYKAFGDTSQVHHLIREYDLTHSTQASGGEK